MLRLIKVSGNSLSPEYREGDFVLIAKIPFLLDRIRVGDMVVFRHPDFGIMIKQVERIGPGPNELFVIGTHPFSVDSRQFGPIERQSILGRVIWHIQKPEL